MLVGGTLAWRSLSQAARNDVQQARTSVPVELEKLEKTPDGEETEIPVPGAEFFLFTKSGAQIGGKYTTDALGKIALSLEPGEYYFEETYPGFGYDFDQDGEGKSIKIYPFIVKGDEEKAVVTVYDRRQVGQLIVTKEVKNLPEGELTESQKSRKFTFTVTFSDGKTYPCRIDGALVTLGPGGTFELCHGQEAVFSDVPVGVQYTVTEQKADDCATFAAGSHGTIRPGEQRAAFLNAQGIDEPEGPLELVVTKVLKEGYPPADRDKTFHFTLTLNGEITEFDLKPGANGGQDSRVFPDVKFGDSYSVVETDTGYILTTDKATGTIALPRTEATFTNEYPRPQTEIGGEKTWKAGADMHLIPPSIPVRLYDGEGRMVEEQTVRPDGEGKWYYTFHAPRYDQDGNEIKYVIREGPVDYFAPSYEGYDITNSPVKPVDADPPVLEKVVEGSGAPSRRFRFLLEAKDGAPLPDKASGTVKSYERDGGGPVEFGTFTFTCPGTFVYTIYETAGSEAGWTYDDARYTLTFVVAAKDGALFIQQQTLVKNGEVADKLVFRNRYTPATKPPGPGGGDDDDDDEVKIKGEKRWVDEGAPEGARPDHVVVYLYADGKLVHQQEVTARDGWRYSVTMPKYQKGRRVVYTVGEEPVPGYECRVEGFDLINTYVGETPSPIPTGGETTTPGPTGTQGPPAEGSLPPTPGEGGAPEATPIPTAPPPDVPKTGDTNELPIWLAVMGSGGLGLMICLGYLYWRKHHYVGKRLMKR